MRVLVAVLLVVLASANFAYRAEAARVEVAMDLPDAVETAMAAGAAWTAGSGPLGVVVVLATIAWWNTIEWLCGQYECDASAFEIVVPQPSN